MPRIFDNIDQHLLPALTRTLETAQRADFCVGYFNLRGWKQLDRYIEPWAGGEDHCCRLLVGMHQSPQDELRGIFRTTDGVDGIDMPTAARLKRRLAQEFRQQLMLGAPTNDDEAGLRRLARQLRERKLIVKLHLRHTLHAKLYLVFRDDFNNPISGFVGSSNLTLSGLNYQGELNVDVLEHDACEKLARWFVDRWDDNFCLDISEELIKVIEESWAREEPLSPYHIYLKMAYHLSQEARAGLSEFNLPEPFRRELFDFQAAAVKIAARHLNKRGGVLLGDVVGLGKTLMATALAAIVEESQGIATLIICPKRLVKMWQSYVDRFNLRARVMSSSVVLNQLGDVPARFRLVVIDESHNLRNPEGKRYRKIKEYLDQSDSRCVLLSATPYNKSYLDLSAQLRLFVPEDADLGVRPEAWLRREGPLALGAYQIAPNTLAAFEKSQEPDDWRELMRLYLVRRTRSFIKQHYALTDPATGDKYLQLADGTRLPFPTRAPKTLKFALRAQDPSDQYARLYAEPVVEVINHLRLPRYGLGNYLKDNAKALATPDESSLLENLSRAGARLLGYCRTNLFKRLESSGMAFVQSVDRHVLRNYIFLYALEQGLPLPIGTQAAEMLDPAINDADADDLQGARDFESEDDDSAPNGAPDRAAYTPEAYRQRAAVIYQAYQSAYRDRFKWLSAKLFTPALKQQLQSDSNNLLAILQQSGAWDETQDRKLGVLERLLTRTHPNEKVVIFTQFADTVNYLVPALRRRGLRSVEGASGQSADPTELAWRFSPQSNQKTYAPEEQIRALIATDVLSEGQNLQDSAIVVNYDLPWAIIRLVQRAGRVDRIGQMRREITCYSFLPAEGVEQIIRLRARVTQRLRENAEVIGTDEEFFEGERNAQTLKDLYTEKSGILDDEADSEIDLSSYAYQIWHDATKDNPALAQQIANLPDVVYAARRHTPTLDQPEGALVYIQTSGDNDALAWVDRYGHRVTQSQLTVLRAAECGPDTPAVSRDPHHHEWVEQAVQWMVQEARTTSGQLGKPSGARSKVYQRLKAYYDGLKARAPLLAGEDLSRSIDALYRYPLREGAKDTLNRQLKAGIRDEDLAELVSRLRKEGALSVISADDEDSQPEAKIICSLGLRAISG
ncbi:MAG: NgoFVII family restriction endonuclease [Chloroflexi bacterium]|nr:NgoFVII family restriction endonuclease [Chloroflexota bacterium]